MISIASLIFCMGPGGLGGGKSNKPLLRDLYRFSMPWDLGNNTSPKQGLVNKSISNGSHD